MKQTFLRAMVVCSLLLVGIKAVRAEVIRSVSSTIRLQKDATLDVTEVIVIDFESASRHGIFRDIPLKYERYNNTYSIHLKVLSVTDGKNKELTYKVSSMESNLDIRIGDADKLITGVHTYKIHYTVTGAIGFIDGKPEVYWNVTGDGWPFTIQKAIARFYPPAPVKVDQLKTRSFRGRRGATQSASSKNESHDVAFYTTKLNTGEGLTIAIVLPKGSVVPPAH